MHGQFFFLHFNFDMHFTLHLETRSTTKNLWNETEILMKCVVVVVVEYNWHIVWHSSLIFSRTLAQRHSMQQKGNSWGEKCMLETTRVNYCYFLCVLCVSLYSQKKIIINGAVRWCGIAPSYFFSCIHYFRDNIMSLNKMANGKIMMW